MNQSLQSLVAESSWNVMTHAQKPDFVFWRNGRFHLNRRGASVQSTTGSRGVRISGSNAGYTMFQGSGYPLQFASFPFTSPPVRHRVPSHFNWSLLILFLESVIHGINQLISFWRFIVISFVFCSSCWGGRNCWHWCTKTIRRSSRPARVITERRKIFNKADIDSQWRAFHSSGKHSASLGGGGAILNIQPWKLRNSYNYMIFFRARAFF